MAETAKTDKKSTVLTVLSLLISAGVLGSMFRGCYWVYQNYFVEPILTYYADTGEFSVQADFRGITMRVYPQMEIRVDNVVFQMTHLSRYFESEMVYFKDRKGCVKKINEEYERELRAYVRAGILTALEESLGEEAMEEIDAHLRVSVSFVAGVEYQAPFRNKPKRYCVIESNGLLVNYGTNEEKIKERLYESELTLKEDPDEVPMDPQVGEIIRVSAEEIGHWYGERIQRA